MAVHVTPTCLRKSIKHYSLKKKGFGGNKLWEDWNFERQIVGVNWRTASEVDFGLFTHLFYKARHHLCAHFI